MKLTVGDHEDGLILPEPTTRATPYSSIEVEVCRGDKEITTVAIPTQEVYVGQLFVSWEET